MSILSELYTNQILLQTAPILLQYKWPKCLRKKV